MKEELSMSRLLVVIVMVLALVGVSNAANMLTNGDWQTGNESGWNAWNGRAVSDRDNLGNALPQLGRSSVGGYGDFGSKAWGPWWGAWNCSGFSQVLPASAGQTWTMTADLMELSNDAITSNAYGVVLLQFYNAANASVGSYELGRVNAASTKDMWFNLSLTQVAPANTATVEAWLGFFQPNGDGGGAAWFDNITLAPEPATLALLGLGGLVLRRRK